jgi:hypothetical protein
VRRPLLIALVGTFTAIVPSQAAARLPSVLTQERPTFQVEPALISYTGDGTALVGGLNGTSVRHPGRIHWTRYDNNEGDATGRLWLNDCVPDCAGGTFSARRVGIHVFSPSARHHFQRLTLRYSYNGHRQVDRFKIRFYRGTGGLPGFWGYAQA